MFLDEAPVGRRDKLIIQIIAIFTERRKVVASIRVYIGTVVIDYGKGECFYRVCNRIQLYCVRCRKFLRDKDKFIAFRKRKPEGTHRCVFSVATRINKNTVCRVVLAPFIRNQRNRDRVEPFITGTANEICAIVGFAVVLRFFQRQATFLVIFIHTICDLVRLHTGGIRGRRHRMLLCSCRTRMTASRQPDRRKRNQLKKCSSFHDYYTSLSKLFRLA